MQGSDRQPPERALCLVSFPHQLLHAIAALIQDRKSRGAPAEAPATMLVWSHRSEQHAPGSPSRAIFERALSGFPWISLVFPSRVERLGRLSPYRKLQRRASTIQRMLGDPGFSHIYYSHDASADHTAQAVMQAFPEAQCVSYGDPPGYVYAVAPGDPWPGRSLSDRIRNVFWATRRTGVARWRSASRYLVALDMNSAECSESHHVEVVPLEVLQETLSRLKNGLPEVAAAEERVLRASKGGVPTLLLLSNLAESGFASRLSEAQLYVDICRSHVREGETIYIKPHAGTSPQFLRRLSSALRAFDPVVLPEELRTLPVEFFSVLLQRARVLSVSSSSALLAHLYGGEITHALTDERILRYIRPEHAAHLTAARRAIARVMNRA